MTERWLDVPGYEGLYQVSDKGRVKSFCRYTEGKLLKPNTDKDGYKTVCLANHKRLKVYKIHRLAAAVFCPYQSVFRNIVNHKDMDESNNDVSNLEWVTHSENVRHAYGVLGNYLSHRKKPVIGTCVKTGVETYYAGAVDTKKAGFSNYHVTSCCTGNRRVHKQHTWRYAGDTEKH